MICVCPVYMQPRRRALGRMREVVLQDDSPLRVRLESILATPLDSMGLLLHVTMGHIPPNLETDPEFSFQSHIVQDLLALGASFAFAICSIRRTRHPADLRGPHAHIDEV